jgi:hypothetical protein
MSRHHTRRPAIEQVVGFSASIKNLQVGEKRGDEPLNENWEPALSVWAREVK